MEEKGVEVELCNRHGHSEQQMPDKTLQVEMLHDCIGHRDFPGVMVLLTGDGEGVQGHPGNGPCHGVVRGAALVGEQL